MGGEYKFVEMELEYYDGLLEKREGVCIYYVWFAWFYGVRLRLLMLNGLQP